MSIPNNAGTECSNHPGNAAITRCAGCGKPVCRHCARNERKEIRCNRCLERHSATRKGGAWVAKFLLGLLGILMLSGGTAFAVLLDSVPSQAWTLKPFAIILEIISAVIALGGLVLLVKAILAQRHYPVNLRRLAFASFSGALAISGVVVCWWVKDHTQPSTPGSLEPNQTTFRSVRANQPPPGRLSEEPVPRFNVYPYSGHGDKSILNRSFEERLLATTVAGSPQVPPAFSPDGTRVAYRGSKGGKQFIAIGDHQGQEFDEVGGPVFSPDGGEVAYWARTGWKYQVVVGEKKGPLFDRVFSQPVFLSDGKTVLYSGGNLKDASAFIIAGEKTIGEGATTPILGPDGKTACFVTRKFGKQRVVVGDQWGESFDDILSPPVFSPDGETVAYGSRQGARQFIVTGGTKGEEFDEVGSPVFSPDGKMVAYGARNNSTRLLVIGSEKQVALGRIFSLAFSPDGKTVAYQTTSGGKQLIVAGARKGEESELVYGPAFTHDGRVAYAVQNGAEKLIVVGEQKWKGAGDFFNSIKDGIFRAIIFSPDDKSFAYVVADGPKQFVVIGENKGEPFDQVLTDPTFSPDGKRLAFGIRNNGELWWKVVEIPQ